MKKKLKIFLSLSLLVLLVSACAISDKEALTDSGSIDEKAEESRVQVMTSIFPVYEIVKKVAGERADVTLIVGKNEDAHHYEPSAQDVARVNEADIFVYSSDVMEFWAERLLNVVENPQLQTVKLAENLNLEIPESEKQADESILEAEAPGEHDDGHVDPHFWLDLTKVERQLPLIVEALAKADPEGADEYRENAQAFSQELLKLDEEYLQTFKEAKQRTFVVQHRAFGHLANRYHLRQVAVGGLSTEVEIDPQTLVKIIRFIKEQRVPVIYYQSGNNSAIAQTIAQETDTEIAVLHDLESKPKEIKEENAYLEAMRENLKQLKKSIR